MSTSGNTTVTLGLVQMRCSTDPAENLDKAIAGIREAAGDGGPDFVFEAIGLPATMEQAIATLPPGGTAVLVGLTKFGQRASLEGFPFVDGGRRILGSNYGSAVAAVDFPRYAEWYLTGRLPIDRLIDRADAEKLRKAQERVTQGSTRTSR